MSPITVLMKAALLNYSEQTYEILTRTLDDNTAIVLPND